MSYSAEQILDAIAPQFVSDTDKDVHLNLAELRTSDCFGTSIKPLAVALRAAHTLTLSSNANSFGGSSGSITSKREGDLSVSFSNNASVGISGDLGQTSYGVQLENLIKNSFVGIRLTGLNIDCAGNVSLEEDY